MVFNPHLLYMEEVELLSHTSDGNEKIVGRQCRMIYKIKVPMLSVLE